jgi:hypothetical protein
MVPSWALAESDTLRVPDERIRHCSLFLGWPTEIGFSVEGTGFLVTVEQDEFSFHYIVTAAHIVWPNRQRRDSTPYDRIYLRINRESGLPLEIPTCGADWLFHPDITVDLCAFQFDKDKHVPNDDASIARVDLLSMVPTQDELDSGIVGIGDEVVIIGAFVGRVGHKSNIPIVRIGNIAAMPEEPVEFGSPRRPAYLIETRSLGGISGSPVFSHILNLKRWAQWSGAVVPRQPKRQISDPAIRTPYNLIGMIIGAHSARYFSDFIAEAETDLRSASPDVEFNAGISVAIPAALIVEFFQMDPVRTPRDAAIEERRRRSGYKPTGSSSVSVPRNPSHKEDFTSLLHAAARKKTQGDQTSPDENDDSSDDS